MKKTETTAFLKECMADALLSLMIEKPFNKITVNEITSLAGVGRATWFRNFENKEDALIFKHIILWSRWCEKESLKTRDRFDINNADSFFRYNYEIRDMLRTTYKSGKEDCVFEAFYKIMTPFKEDDTKELYEKSFYSHGLFGLLDKWIKRDFKESPQEMVLILQSFYK